MTLDTGSRLGPYQILGPLGAGGMGEVYRAKDTRLDRIVAVKVLPAHLSSNPELKQRFEREARAVSSLSHPHICTLFDVGHHDGTDFLVMEHLEGETLASRLERGPLPFPELMRAAIEIAGALDRAHRGGIVHRDLKPGNVMMTKTGTKLLDFGLAKGMGATPAMMDLTATPTLTRPLTAEGAIVGTFQYMAPEQLEGKEADARSDLFAFGAMVYEMATGRRPFEGKSKASVIASVLKDEPRSMSDMSDTSATAPATPPSLERLVRQCLVKDPEERLQSAHDLRLQLEAIAEAGLSSAESPAAVSPARPVRRERLAWGLAALALLAAIAIAAAALGKTPASVPLIVSSIAPPDGAGFESVAMGMTLSADGRQIAFLAHGASRGGIWVRSLDDPKPRLLAGTEGADCPFWSPDSRSIGFFSEGRLRKMEVSSGQSDVLATMNYCLGASWSGDGTILYVPDRYAPIMKVATSGGQPVAITGPQPAGSKRIYSQPSLLPDRRHLLYTVNESWEGGEKSGIFVASMDGKDERRILPVLSNARYVEPGYLLYAKDGSLRAQKFDAARLELSGEPIPLIDGIQYLGYYQSHLFSVSDAGLLAYVAGQGTLTRQLTWVDRKGVILETVGSPGNYFSPRLSHDGRRITYDQSEATTDSGDIWTYDRQRGIPSRLTFDPRNESSPVWSPDDRTLLFFGNSPGRSDLFVVPSDGTGKVEMVFSNGADNLPTDWSKDGKSVVMQQSHGDGLGNTDLWIYSVEDRKATPWLESPYVEKQGRFSPDKRFIAYDSNESGKTEIYVRGYEPAGGKWRISADGGTAPVWRADGKELFYVSPDSRLMSVAVGQGAAFEGSAPSALFKIPGEMLGLSLVAQYDAAPDGQRFLFNLDTPSEGRRTISLVSNWISLLNKR